MFRKVKERSLKMFRKVAVVLISVVLAVSLMATAAFASEALDPVTVEGGLVTGVPTDVEGVAIYKGIPFGASTAGENRWKAPQPVEPWEGEMAADTWGDQAVQTPASILFPPVDSFYGDEFYYPEEYTPDISEDCLNLNLYTPAASADEKLPVLMYIHGGGNQHGHASEMEFYAPKLAAKGIVVVSVQYRVSMYGFLTLPGLSAENEYGSSGNYAILDLIAALKWIQNNVAAFGGDPDNITISGQSAGAMNVTALLRSPLAKGLFQNAIIQSGFYGFVTEGGALPYSDMKTVQEEAQKAVIAAMGLPEDISPEDLVAELRSHEWEYYRDTMSAVDETQDLYTAITNASSGYVIDGYVFTEESVDLLAPGALDGVNIMIGGTSDEYTSLSGDPDGEMSLEEFAASMEEAYGEDYTSGYEAADEKEAYRVSLRAKSDRLMQIYRVSAEYANKYNDTNAYVYYFNHDMPKHANPSRDEDFYGSYHSSELWYYFNSMRDVEGQRQWTDEDYALGEVFSTYIANFVKTGNPGDDWAVCSAENDGAFMWYHDDIGECTTQVYPEREALNLANVLASYGISEEDLK